MFRSRLFASLPDAITLGGISEDPNQLNMFDLFPSEDKEAAVEFKDIDEWADDEKLQKEKESLAFYITGHPLDRFTDVINRSANVTTQDLFTIKDKSVVKLFSILYFIRALCILQ